jgi:hypothetical protein
MWTELNLLVIGPVLAFCKPLGSIQAGDLFISWDTVHVLAEISGQAYELKYVGNILSAKHGRSQKMAISQLYVQV